MGFDATNQTSHNKFNLPKKIFGDTSNTMNPASVPRKLRSAIKKRSCEPLSYSKGVSRFVNSVEPPRNNCLKKLKPNTNDCFEHSPNGPALFSLSKEEEEVAETLSALAALIPPSKIHINNNVDCELKGSVLLNEETNVGSHPVSYETNVTIVPDGLSKESVQENCPTDPENLGRSKLSEQRQLNLNLQVSENLIIRPLLKNCEMKEEQALLSSNESHMRLGTVDGVTNHERQLGISLENTGLTSSATHEFGVGHSLQPTLAVMFPSWLNTTATSSSGLGTREEDNVSIDKVSWSTNGSGKSWKKCVTHVYITRLIQSLQISQGNDAPPSDASHLRPSHCVSGPLDPLDNSYAARIDPNRKLTSPVNHSRHHEQERPSISGCCGSTKQGFDFPFLSAADNTEGKSSSFERGAKGHMDFPHSVGQNGALVSYSLHQNHLASYSYQDHVGVISGSQVHLPIPPYLSNPFGTSHMTTTTAKTALQVWPATLTTPLNSGPFLSSHITNWQNRRQNSQSDASHHMHMPPFIPSSSPSLGVVHGGPKYLHVSQQPLPLVGLGSSLPPLRAKSQHNQLPLHL